MHERTFRLSTRPALLTVAFALAAVACAAGGFAAVGSPGGMLGALLAAVVFAVVAVRCALLRVVTDRAGLTVHNVLYTKEIPWSQVRMVTAGSTGADIDAGLLSVRSVVVTLADGRRVRAAGVSAWSSAPVREIAEAIGAARP